MRNRYPGRCEACGTFVKAEAGVYSDGVLCASCARDLAIDNPSVTRALAKAALPVPAPRKTIEWKVGDRAGSRDCAGRGYDMVFTVESITVQQHTSGGRPCGTTTWLYGKDTIGRNCSAQGDFCDRLKS